MTDVDSEQSGPWPKPGVSAAVFDGPRVLLVQRAKPPFQDAWSLPGGHIHPGETALAAAERELLEETHIRADLEGVLDVRDVILYREDGTLDRHYVITVFFGRWREGEARPASDARDVRWAGLDELDGLNVTEGAQSVIRAALSRLQAAAP